MSYVFGIDLGTTYSCISYIDEYGKAVVLKNSDGDHTTPSVVMVESENNIIGISKDFPCRWKYENDKFEEERSSLESETIPR